MDAQIKYRGRTFRADEIEFVRELIAENPADSRWVLSRKLCRAWNWVQPNGHLKDMVCRGFMLELERAGFIKLPPKRYRPHNPSGRHRKPAKIDIEPRPFTGPVSKIRPLDIHQVRRTPAEKVFNSLIEQYHYLGYCQPVGEHLKYIVYAQEHPIACFAFSSAPRHIGCRDRFIGWDKEARQKNLQFMAYNSRFLVLPWVESKCLASHLLGRIGRRISFDWQNLYNHPIYYLETFVDTERGFEGTCYKAANWIYLGLTTGRGKNDQTHKQNRSIKAVWGYPLHKKFKELLREVPG
jgi:hypothetical protein